MAKKFKKKKGPKNQHFVPRFYLSEFVDPDTPTGQQPYVWVFSKDGKSKKRKAPENLFTATHLYTINRDGEKDFSVEEKLSKIESRFVDVIKTIKQKKPLSLNEHNRLCVFIAAQLQRTLRAKRNQEGFVQQLIDRGVQISLAHGVTDSKQIRDWINYKNDIHKLQLIESLSFLTNILEQMNVAFLCSNNPIKHPFISSDDPCVLFNPDLQWQRFYGPAFGQRNVQLTMALTPGIMVLFSWSEFKGYSSISGGYVENINRMTRSYSDKEFISFNSKKRLIWFSPVPLNIIFILKIIKTKINWFLHDYKNSWRNRKMYGKK